MRTESARAPIPGTSLRPLVIIFDALGRITHWSESCRDLYGPAVTAVRGQNIRNVLRVLRYRRTGIDFPLAFEAEGGGCDEGIAWTMASVAGSSGDQYMVVTGAYPKDCAAGQVKVPLGQSRLLSPMPIWTFDRSTLALVDVNVAALDSYGYGRDELVGRSIQDICGPNDLDRLLEVLVDLYEACTSPWMQRRKDGSTFAAEVDVIPTERAGCPAAIAIVSRILGTQQGLAPDSSQNRMRSGWARRA